MTPESVCNSICTDATPDVQSWKQRQERVLQSPAHLRSRARAQMGVSGKAVRRLETAATERRRAVYTTANARGSSTPKALMTEARLPSPYVTLNPASRAACAGMNVSRALLILNHRSQPPQTRPPVLSGPQLANAVAPECCRLTAEQLMWSTSLDSKTSAVNNAQLQDCAAPGHGWAAGRSRCTAAARCPQTPPAGSAHQQRAL